VVVVAAVDDVGAMVVEEAVEPAEVLLPGALVEDVELADGLEPHAATSTPNTASSKSATSGRARRPARCSRFAVGPSPRVENIIRALPLYRRK
jgi:hypothetical protein